MSPPLFTFLVLAYIKIGMSYIILAGCFENLRSMILQGQEVLQQRRYSSFSFMYIPGFFK
jgi:hypothetical protein